jgi:hypothetical protein
MSITLKFLTNLNVYDRLAAIVPGLAKMLRSYSGLAAALMIKGLEAALQAVENLHL